MSLKFVIFDPDEHVDVLYELLKNRKYSISHRKTTTKTEHRNFCLNHPYRYWYLIYNEDDPIGAFYITYENCIAINLIADEKDFFDQALDYIFLNFKPLPEVPSIKPPYFFCNIHPSNKKYIESVSANSGELVQFSYAFKDKNDR